MKTELRCVMCSRYQLPTMNGFIMYCRHALIKKKKIVFVTSHDKEPSIRAQLSPWRKCGATSEYRHGGCGDACALGFIEGLCGVLVCHK